MRRWITMLAILVFVPVNASAAATAPTFADAERIVTEILSDNTLDDTSVEAIDAWESYESDSDIPLASFSRELVETLITDFSPKDYYIDDEGLHWNHPTGDTLQADDRDCNYPYGFSIKGVTHFVYWFFYRFPSYDAYMMWVPIRADRYDDNGIMVQKRDICTMCLCNPYCALIWTWICEK